MERQPKSTPFRARTVLDASNIMVASILALTIVVRWTGARANVRLLSLAVGLPLGFLTADVASGFVHWFSDTYLGEGTKVVGPMLIAPFREHHRDPLAIARHCWLERNGNNCLASLPILVVASFGGWDLSQCWGALASGFFFASALTLCLANQIHAWAHAVDPPRFVRWLQRNGLLLSPERHRTHHESFERRGFAIVCGWSNRWLDQGRLLSCAGWLLARLGLHAHDNEIGA
jgi:ubiquitin-conjugating enzyme E2 variant